MLPGPLLHRAHVCTRAWLLCRQIQSEHTAKSRHLLHPLSRRCASKLKSLLCWCVVCLCVCVSVCLCVCVSVPVPACVSVSARASFTTSLCPFALRPYAHSHPMCFAFFFFPLLTDDDNGYDARLFDEIAKVQQPSCLSFSSCSSSSCSSNQLL